MPQALPRPARHDLTRRLRSARWQGWRTALTARQQSKHRRDDRDDDERRPGEQQAKHEDRSTANAAYGLPVARRRNAGDEQRDDQRNDRHSNRVDPERPDGRYEIRRVKQGRVSRRRDRRSQCESEHQRKEDARAFVHAWATS